MSVETTEMTQAIEAAWVTMLGLEARAEAAQLNPRLRPSTLTGCIQITGAWQGAVTVECPGGLARRVASIIFGSEASDITRDQASEAIGELTNIIGDNIKALLPEPSQLSLPAVTEGMDNLFCVPGSRATAQLSFTCEGKPFQVTILQCGE